jgi:hypothetical protein
MQHSPLGVHRMEYGKSCICADGRRLYHRCLSAPALLGATGRGHHSLHQKKQADENFFAVIPAKELRLRALLGTAYMYGFRSGELLELRVHQVDLSRRTIRLDPGATKNNDGRIIKMTREVFDLLSACVSGIAKMIMFLPDTAAISRIFEVHGRHCVRTLALEVS